MSDQEPPTKLKKLALDFSQVTRTKSILNQNQVQKLWNATPKKYIKDRPAKGGGKWDYVKVGYVRQVLDSVFGFDWDFIVETTLEEAFNVAKMTNSCVVKGMLIGRVVDDAGRIREIKKAQVGRADVKWLTKKDQQGNKTKVYDDFTGAPIPLDFGNDMKAAFSDCLKKCASLLGIAADIYEKEDFMEITILDADENSTRAKATQKRIEKVKSELKAEVVDENPAS